MSAFPKGTHSSLRRNRVPFAFSIFPKIFSFASLALVSGLACTQPLSKPDLAELQQLSSAGMSEFSLVLLDENTPDINESPSDWVEWQKYKVTLYQERGQWQDLIELSESLPESVPAEYRQWLQAQVIDAYLSMGDGESARDLLMSRLWAADESDADPQLTNAGHEMLRRLVVQSYLTEGRTADALSSVLRYDQDYPNSHGDARWRALKGQVLISKQRFGDAAEITAGNKDQVGVAVNILARLKSGAALDWSTLQTVLVPLKSLKLDQEFKNELFAVALDKAVNIHSLPERLSVLEQLVSAKNINNANMTDLADALWQAYGAYGQALSNRLQLLLGNFDSWFESAARLAAASPVEARALYVYLAQRVDDKTVQLAAHEKLVDHLAKRTPEDKELLKALYLASSQYSDVSSLPLSVLYLSVDTALEEGNIELASKLMGQLDAPNGVDLAEWQLRRARVQVLTGVSEYGADLLEQIVRSNQLSTKQIEYLIQVVFDLQNSRQYQRAYDILAVLLPHVPDLVLHRQVLFLMADSLVFMHQYAGAARLYLRSAMLDPTQGNDSWGQAARYQAAQAMVKVGLVYDALKLYRQLYEVADRPDRKAMLKREIQFLSMK